MNISRMISSWEAISATDIKTNVDSSTESSNINSPPRFTEVRKCHESEFPVMVENKKDEVKIDEMIKNSNDTFMSDAQNVGAETPMNMESNVPDENISFELEDLEMENIVEELDSTLNEFNLYVEDKNSTLKKNKIKNAEPANKEDTSSVVNDSTEATVPLRKTSIQERRMNTKSLHLLQIPAINSDLPTADIKSNKLTLGGLEDPPTSESPKSPALAFMKKIFQKNDSTDNISSCSDSPIKSSPAARSNSDVTGSPNGFRRGNRQSLQLALDPNYSPSLSSPKSPSRFSFYTNKSGSPKRSRESSPKSAGYLLQSPVVTQSPLVARLRQVSNSSPQMTDSQTSPTSDKFSKSMFSKGRKNKSPTSESKKKYLRHTQSSPNKLMNTTTSKSNSTSKFAKLIKKEKKSPSSADSASTFFTDSSPSESMDPNTSPQSLPSSGLITHDTSGFKYFNPKDGSASPSTLRKGVHYVEPVKILRFQSVPDGGVMSDCRNMTNPQ